MILRPSRLKNPAIVYLAIVAAAVSLIISTCFEGGAGICVNSMGCCAKSRSSCYFYANLLVPRENGHVPVRVLVLLEFSHKTECLPNQILGSRIESLCKVIHVIVGAPGNVEGQFAFF